jgi:hypothetical protein
MSTTPQQPTYVIPGPAGPNWKTPLLIGALLLLLGSNIYLFVQLDRMRTDNRAQIANLNNQFTSAIEKMKLDSSEAVRQSTQRVQSLQSELARSRRAAEQAVGQAKIDAQRRVESLQAKVTEEQAAQQQAIAAVKQTADTTTTKLDSVNTDVQIATPASLRRTPRNCKLCGSWVNGTIRNSPSLSQRHLRGFLM